MAGHLPILGPQNEWIPIKTAIQRTRRSDKTIRGWCAQFGISRQTSKWAPLEIHEAALEMVRGGDLVALELLRAGDRADPRVARYLRYFGF